MSSSTPGQWIPSPEPTMRQLARCSGLASESRHDQVSGTLMATIRELRDDRFMSHADADDPGVIGWCSWVLGIRRAWRSWVPHRREMNPRWNHGKAAEAGSYNAVSDPESAKADFVLLLPRF
jgi:hypothetical protein